MYFNFLYVWKFGWIHDHIWNQTGSNQNLPIWLLKKWQQCVELQTMGSNYFWIWMIYTLNIYVNFYLSKWKGKIKPYLSTQLNKTSYKASYEASQVFLFWRHCVKRQNIWEKFRTKVQLGRKLRLKSLEIKV